jgi:Xaa-Pro aminopeptidase
MTDGRTKTAQHVAAIEEVLRAAEAALEMVLEYLRTSSAPTAKEAHAIVDSVLETFNCESPEGHIIACGLQSAEPHEKGTGMLMRNVPIVIDLYPRSKATGYFADISRTVCLGKPPEALQKMYDAVLGAQELAIRMVKPGAAGKDIQSAVEDYFTNVGYATSGKGKEFTYAEGFVHGVGHGVGLSIHEAPQVRAGDDVLREGDVITIEPGLYYKNIGGVRIEDMLFVTADGYRNLTRAPKQFVL